jgi:hypothetical protein
MPAKSARAKLSTHSTDADFHVNFFTRSLACARSRHYSRRHLQHTPRSILNRTMLTEQDIRSAARLLVAQRGECAPSHAAIRAAMLIKEGNQAGSADWMRVKRAAEELLGSGVSIAS